MLTKRNKVWYVDIYAGGQRVRKSTGTSNRSEAARFELKLRQELYNRNQLQRYMWRDAVVRYLKQLPKDRTSIKDDIRHFKYLDNFLGELYLDQINGDLIARIVETRLGEGVTPYTINRLLGSLSCVLNKAYKTWQWIDRLPPIERLKEPPPRDRVLTHEESAKLIAHAADHLKPIITFALQTGLRKANILNLKWSQVDLANQVIQIKADEFKNRTSHTQLISDETTKLLKDLLGNLKETPEYVFLYKGNKINSVKTGFNRAVERAGIPPCRFHDLRRTQATRLRAAGVTAENIQALNGWRDIKTALKYAREDPTVLRRELEKLSNQSQIQSQPCEKVVLH